VRRRTRLRIVWFGVGLALLGVVVWRSDPAGTWQRFVASLDHPWLLAGALTLLSVMMTVIWLVMVGANFLLVRATAADEPGPPLTLPHLTALMAVMAASIFVSPTPGGLGVSEGASILFLRQLGYTQNFVPFLLLSRVALYLASGLLLAAGQWLGEPLPAASANPSRRGGSSEGSP